MVRTPRFHAEDASPVPGRGTKIPQAVQRSQKKKKGIVSGPPVSRCGLFCNHPPSCPLLQHYRFECHSGRWSSSY